MSAEEESFVGKPHTINSFFETLTGPGFLDHLRSHGLEPTEEELAENSRKVVVPSFSEVPHAQESQRPLGGEIPLASEEVVLVGE